MSKLFENVDFDFVIYVLYVDSGCKFRHHKK